VDDLINWASRASTRAKSEPGHVVAFVGTGSDGPEFVSVPAGTDGRIALASLSQGPRILVEDYAIRPGGAATEVTVCLRREDETRSATATYSGGEILQAVATATGDCLQGFLAPTVSLSVGEIRVTTEAEAPGAVTAWVRMELPDRQEWLLGPVPLHEDRYRSVINAVLDATNRRMAWLSQFRAADPRPESVEADAPATA